MYRQALLVINGDFMILHFSIIKAKMITLLKRFLPSFDVKCFIELKEYFLHILCLIVKGRFCAHLSSLNKFSSSFNAFRFSFIVYPIRVPNKDVCKSSGALSFIFTAP